LRPILVDGDCIDLEVFEGVLEMDEDEGRDREFSRGFCRGFFWQEEAAFWESERVSATVFELRLPINEAVVIKKEYL